MYQVEKPKHIIMTSIKLYYVLGQLVYAIARANEPINKKERRELHDIFVSKMDSGESELDFSEVISHILDKEKKDLETTYNWVIQSLKLPQNELDEDTKSKFFNLIELVVNKFPSKGSDGEELLARLRTDLQRL